MENKFRTLIKNWVLENFGESEAENASWIQYQIKNGTYKEPELIRYRKQVAEYELAKQ